MRVLAGRGYWQPQQRIAQLRRYAFLGDSYVFGQGVEPDETLPARSERHLNEISGGAPVEAVNFGVCGYNIWNAWFSFKRVPQVFDGAVLVVCSNDAQLLGRTYNVDYGGRTTELWQPDHAIHDALSACLDDLAAFSRGAGLSVAVCYYNVYPGQPLERQRWSTRIAEAVAKLCAERALPFVDLASHIAGRKIPDTELVVGEADYHPSALVHDAAARHLARALREQGWLADTGKVDLIDAPERIASIAHAMIETDAYPADIAISWAARALEAKELAVRRRQGPTPIEAFWPAAGRVSAELDAARGLWHACMRTSSVFANALTAEGGLGAHLSLIDEEMLRLEELSLAARGKDDDGVLTGLMKSVQTSEAELAKGITDAQIALGAMDDELRAQNSAAEALRAELASSWLSKTDDLARAPSDIDGLTALIGRIRMKIAEYLQFIATLPALFPERGASGAIRPLGLLKKSVANAVSSFILLRKIVDGRIGGARLPDHTTVEATVAVNAIAGRYPCVLEVQVNCTAPLRLPLIVRRNFLPNGSRATLSFRFPAFYGGKAIVAVHIPETIADRVEAELIDLNIYNREVAGRRLSREQFGRDSAGRLVSPPVCLE
jgi:lysophospholipase L1-like esterase